MAQGVASSYQDVKWYKPSSFSSPGYPDSDTKVSSIDCANSGFPMTFTLRPYDHAIVYPTWTTLYLATITAERNRVEAQR
jgi:hypothetical protein